MYWLIRPHQANGGYGKVCNKLEITNLWLDGYRSDLSLYRI